MSAGSRKIIEKTPFFIRCTQKKGFMLYWGGGVRTLRTCPQLTGIFFIDDFPHSIGLILIHNIEE